MLATEDKDPSARVQKRILIVEDDLCLKPILGRLLGSLDETVGYTWLTKAEDATDVLEHIAYDLVICDHFLEGQGTGLELWDHCVLKYPKLPFMLMSGLEMDRFFRLIGPKTAPPAFLPKPFRPGECRQIVTSLLHPRLDIFNTWK